MGGNIIEHEGRLFRLRQDFSAGHGDGLIVFEIDELSDAYSERTVGRIRFTDRRGPHTLNVGDDQIVFDWYQDRVSLLVGSEELDRWCGINSRSACARRKQPNKELLLKRCAPALRGRPPSNGREAFGLGQDPALDHLSASARRQI